MLVVAGHAGRRRGVDGVRRDELGVRRAQAPGAAAAALAAGRRARRSASCAAILTARRPDVLHTHTAKAGATGRIAALLAGSARPRAVVHTYHGHVLSGYFGRRWERVFRRIEWLLAHATGTLVAVSDEVRDDLVRLGVAPAERFAVVPYGFDLPAWSAADDEARERGSEPSSASATRRSRSAGPAG